MASSCFPLFLRHRPIWAKPFSAYAGSCAAFSKCSAACLNRPTFLSAVPRSYDSCPSGVSVDAVASIIWRGAPGIGALSLFSVEARFGAEQCSCARDKGLVSFTFLFPVGYESKWVTFAILGPFKVVFESVTFQRLCVCLRGCERGNTARASAGSFSWERWRVEGGEGWRLEVGSSRLVADS